MLSLGVLDVAAEVPPGAEPKDVDQGLYHPSPADLDVVIELAPLGRWVAEYYPCETTEELGDGRLRVTLRTPDPGWVRRLALRLGENGRIVAPASLAVPVREAAAAALAQYAGEVSHPGTRPGPR
jgi:proteasome accessory factor C